MMENGQVVTPASNATWKAGHVLVLCVVCLVVGLAVGYLLRGSASQTAPAPVAQQQLPADQPAMNTSAGTQASQQMPQQMPSLDDMKRMANKKAESLLAQLKSNPKDPKLLNQIGLVYKSAHQFDEAATYFQKSLEVDPKNIAVRADYASCLYFTGNVDGALEQLNKSLTYDPKHAGTLMNIGIIKWKGKGDANGAVEAWEKVLKYHPDFPQKDVVEQMIAQVKQAKNAAAGQKS
jgi:cytochrome c-type biogenesis protein CcmH/NrfG